MYTTENMKPVPRAAFTAARSRDRNQLTGIDTLSTSTDDVQEMDGEEGRYLCVCQLINFQS